MNVLIDTSVWIDHFRNGNALLVELLLLDRALTHPMIIGEIACGTPPAPRAQTLAYIGSLRPSHQANMQEVMDFIEREKVYGSGCGLIDVSLLASTLITPMTQLWTLDKRLAKLASDFDAYYVTSMH